VEGDERGGQFAGCALLRGRRVVQRAFWLLVLEEGVGGLEFVFVVEGGRRLNGNGRY
jgi:hypothetical protein